MCVYCKKANEIATIERIEAISNGIMNDAINAELSKLNDEKINGGVGVMKNYPNNWKNKTYRKIGLTELTRNRNVLGESF